MRNLKQKRQEQKCRDKRNPFVWLILPICLIIYLSIEIVGICRYGNLDETCRADVAIVLGASTQNGIVSEVYKERIHHAILLYQEGMADKIILTGGVGNGNQVSDARAAREYAVSMGVKAEDALIEETSTITQENLENAKEIMDSNGMKKALIVSDPLHMKRAMLLAKDAGIDAYSSPTRTSRYQTLKTKIPFVVRELFYYEGYRIYRVFTV